jgi:hypothetical protein
MDPIELKPGLRIRVTQQIKRREGTWETSVEGVIRQVREEKTGSWYAHAKGDRYWLRRVELAKNDGEITTLTLDQNSNIEVLGSAEATPAG